MAQKHAMAQFIKTRAIIEKNSPDLLKRIKKTITNAENQITEYNKIDKRKTLQTLKILSQSKAINLHFQNRLNNLIEKEIK